MAKKLLGDEVQQICGERHERGDKRRASRHGHQRGWISISGQKVAIERPRVRAGEELVLDRYALMQRKEAMPEAALQRMVRGVSTRDYADVIDTARESFGIRRSSVSRAFIEASRREVEELLCARFDGVRFPAIFIDGVEYADTTMVVALGLTEDGQKRILGFREGASENAEVCKSLLDELCERGLCRAPIHTAGARRIEGTSQGRPGGVGTLRDHPPLPAAQKAERSSARSRAPLGRDSPPVK
jgi:transposase-like protein